MTWVFRSYVIAVNLAGVTCCLICMIYYVMRLHDAHQMLAVPFVFLVHDLGSPQGMW